MVLDGLSALEQLDVVGGRVDLFGQLRLGHFVGPFLAASVPDAGSDFCPCFLHGNDVIRSVHFRKTLSIGSRFVNLETSDVSAGLDFTRWDEGGLAQNVW